MAIEVLCRYDGRGAANTLTLTTRITDPVSGSEAHYAVVWEKVASL
jgi:hypothetical protein